MEIQQIIERINTLLDTFNIKEKVFSERNYIDDGDWVIYVGRFALHQTDVEQSTILETFNVPGFGIDEAIHMPGNWIEPDSVDVDENIYTTTSIYVAIHEIVEYVIVDKLNNSLEYHMETNNEKNI